jgi:hypothetical protein
MPNVLRLLLSLWKWVPGISPGVNAAGAYGWRPITLVVPNVEMIRGLNLPGTPRATPACRGTPLFTLLGLLNPYVIQNRILLLYVFDCSDSNDVAGRSYKTLVNIYQSARRDTPKTWIMTWILKRIIGCVTRQSLVSSGILATLCTLYAYRTAKLTVRVFLVTRSKKRGALTLHPVHLECTNFYKIRSHHRRVTWSTFLYENHKYEASPWNI